MPGMAFLRPYVMRRLQPTKRGQVAYLRLYGCLFGGPTAGIQRDRTRTYGTAKAKGADTTLAVAETNAGVQDRSAISLRRQELRAADALHYPRYQAMAARQSVAEFRVANAAVKADERADARVELSGRVMAVQRLGARLLFFKVQDEGAHVQVMVSLRGLVDAAGTPVAAAAFKQAARLLQRGDHVAVAGRATRTSSGELTLAADGLPHVLTPALAPLPTRLLDGDTRAQSRHLDLLVNADAAAALRLRAVLIRALRGFLETQRFVEVQTPVLAAAAGGATARPFVTATGDAGAVAGTAAGAEALRLRIAPELWLKRLVVGGLDRVFEVGPCFRNEGIDATHNPEFTMCEFYAAYWTLPQLVAATEQLMACLGALATPQAGPGARRCAAGGPFVQLEFVPTLAAALPFALPDLEAADAYTTLQTLLQQHHIDVGPSDSLAHLLDRLAGTYLEPRSAADCDGPLFITNHPAVMSPLAKSFVCPRTGQRVAARAELFVDGHELSNMYEEENDPAAQRRKMAAQGAVDENYIAALEAGLPPTGGWGCGVERLVMLFGGFIRIGDCLSFGTLRHVVGMSRHSCPRN